MTDLKSENNPNGIMEIASAVDGIDADRMRHNLWVMQCYCRVTPCAFCEFSDICSSSWEPDHMPCDWDIYSNDERDA